MRLIILTLGIWFLNSNGFVFDWFEVILGIALVPYALFYDLAGMSS